MSGRTAINSSAVLYVFACMHLTVAIDAADCDAFVASVHLTVAVVQVMGYRSCAVNTHLFLAAEGDVQDWH